MLITRRAMVSGGVGLFGQFGVSMARAADNAGGAIDTALISQFGCSIYDFLTGPIAIWAFVLVVIGTLLVGLLAKVDFSKIITVVVIFALIQGVGTWVFSNPDFSAKLGTASCLSS